MCVADKNVIHGDLKSKNVLLSRNFATAKLSDVGMARVHASTVVTGVRSLLPVPAGLLDTCEIMMLLGPTLN